MSKLHFVDPIKSLRSRQCGAGHRFDGKRKGGVHNPYGIGGMLPGDPALNKRGLFGTENETMYAIAARYHAAKGNFFKPGNKMNPWGSKGKPGPKMKRTRKRINTRPPEALSVVKEQREITELAKRSGPQAIKVLDNILKSKLSSDMAKIAAAHAVLDRGYGKATQTNINENRNGDGRPKEVDSAELDRRIAATLDRIDGIAGGTRKKIKSAERPADLREHDRDTGKPRRLH